jgi:hypothetical protein
MSGDGVGCVISATQPMLLLWISGARLTSAEAFGLNIGAPNGALAFDFEPQPSATTAGAFSLGRAVDFADSVRQ